MAKESESNGNQIVGLDDGNVSNEKAKRNPRWTRQETLVLIEAKEVTENSPHKGRKISSALLGNAATAAVGGSSSSAAAGGSGPLAPASSLLFDNTEPKWVMISYYCKQQGVDRGPAQCRKRWSNLIGDYRKVKSWESKLEDKADSFWYMRNDVRKQKKLPVTFDLHLFMVLETRDTGVFSPLPLQAIANAAAAAAASDAAAAAASDAAAEVDYEEGVDDEEDEEDDEQETPEFTQMSEVVKSADAEKPVNNFCIPKPVSEEQHHQAFQKKNKRDMNQETPKESSPSFSDWDAQEKGKRPRLSTDECKSNEAKIIRVLEENNRLLSAQLESRNKNCELEREERKQNNTELISALSKLTDVLAKIAEKYVN